MAVDFPGKSGVVAQTLGRSCLQSSMGTDISCLWAAASWSRALGMLEHHQQLLVAACTTRFRCVWVYIRCRHCSCFMFALCWKARSPSCCYVHHANDEWLPSFILHAQDENNVYAVPGPGAHLRLRPYLNMLAAHIYCRRGTKTCSPFSRGRSREAAAVVPPAARRCANAAAKGRVHCPAPPWHDALLAAAHVGRTTCLCVSACCPAPCSLRSLKLGTHIAVLRSSCRSSPADPRQLPLPCTRLYTRPTRC